jgi:hypothetical protein
MARPTTAPRLAKVVPEKLAADTVARVFHLLTRFAVPLSPSIIHVDKTVPDAQHDLAVSVIDLCAWAQLSRGDPDEIEDLVFSVSSPLFGRAIDWGTFRTPELDRNLETDPTDEIVLVLLAALARLRLVRREPLSPRELAALSNRTSYNVRHHIREKKLRKKKRNGPVLVDAAEAERWLREVENADKEGLERSLPAAETEAE